jgi:hypothetical protein
LEDHGDDLAQSMRRDVVALYVDKHGPYPLMVDEWWDAERNADTYPGPLPVVAHPPCGPWGRLKHLNKFQRKEHAVHAVEFVRRWGGVLEHPHGSSLFRSCGMPWPGELPDAWGGWTIEIDQCRFGHVARKMTWLYIVGCPREELPAIPVPRQPTHWCAGRRVAHPGRPRQTLVPAGIKIASAEQRRRTPVLFAQWLLEVAARCGANRRLAEDEARSNR